jgi:hypothetical protein
MSEPTKKRHTFEEQKDQLFDIFNKYRNAMHELTWSQDSKEVRAKLHDQQEKSLKSFLMFIEVLNRSENKN